jgi:L-malate glycosyltransferase
VKKRILQFIGSFHQGGSERQVVGLTRLLKNEGSLDVFAATLNNEGVLRTEIDELGLPEIPEFPLTSFYNVSFLSQVSRCAKYLRENKIDLVHTHDFYTNVFGMAAATLAGVPSRVASKRETTGMRTGGQRFVEKLAFGRANAVIANSVAVREHLVRHGVTEGKIRVIYNGIDIGRFAAGQAGDRQNPGLPTGQNVKFVTLVANLRHDVKNVPMLLRVAQRVIAIRPDVHFAIAGEGDLETELKDRARQLGVVENVHFIGRCIDIPALLAVSHVCVLTSTAEGFSNSILEYMAAGKPVVATNVGGAREAIVDGKSGFLIPSDDDETMAARLIELLDDDRRSADFGAAGKQIITDKFSEKVQLQQTLELYNSLL